MTRVAIRDARRKELEDEILNSEKLRAHFEDNPRDLEVLRHDKTLISPKRVQPHMKYVPSYLLPKGISEDRVKEDAPAQAARKRKGPHGGAPAKRHKKNSQNPLKSFQSSLS